MRGGWDVPGDITTVCLKLMVMLKSVQALANRSHRICKYISEWATQGSVIGVKQFTNQYTLSRGFNSQPPKVEQSAEVASVPRLRAWLRLPILLFFK